MSSPTDNSQTKKTDKELGPMETLGREHGLRQKDFHDAAAGPREVICMQAVILGLEAEKARAEKFMQPNTTTHDNVTIFITALRDNLYVHSNFVLCGCSYSTKLVTNQPHALEELVANLVATEEDFENPRFASVFPEYIARRMSYFVTEDVLMDPQFNFLRFGGISNLFVVNQDDQVEKYAEWQESRKNLPSSRGRRTTMNPWLSGSFYLIALLAILFAFRLVFVEFNPLLIPVIIAGVILAISVIGALTLKNQDILRDKPFVDLMALALRRLPGFPRSTRERDNAEGAKDDMLG